MEKFEIMKSILEVADSLPFNSPQRNKLRIINAELLSANRIDVVFNSSAYLSDNLRERTLVSDEGFNKLVKNKEAA